MLKSAPAQISEGEVIGWMTMVLQVGGPCAWLIEQVSDQQVAYAGSSRGSGRSSVTDCARHSGKGSRNRIGSGPSDTSDSDVMFIGERGKSMCE